MKKLVLSHSIINKKLDYIFILIVIIYIVFILSLYKIMVNDSRKYNKLLAIKTNRIYTGTLGERGNIYDRNGKLLVGNKKIKIITYDKSQYINELEMSLNLANNIDLDYSSVNTDMIKSYILKKNYSLISSRVSDNIKDKYNRGEIDSNNYNKILLRNISEEEINNLDEIERKAAYIYNLLNKGYYYEYKIIKNDGVTEEEENYINSIDSSIKIRVRYERYYPYGNILKSVFGSVGSIPVEKLGNYTSKGYNMDSIVGVSYLESMYEDYLKGVNETYKIDAAGNKVLLTSASKGSDVYLSIDIDLQSDIENIIYEEILKAKKEANTEYYSKVYSIITSVSSGEIVALVGTSLIANEIIDTSVNTIIDAVTPGSIVKGASHLIGYKSGSIDFGTSVIDDCVYIKNTPKKCSWKRLGKIDDLMALKYSSNFYQYLIAINIAGGTYRKGYGLKLNSSAFNTYRKFFNEFGLGVKTGIDLPIEMIGFIGNDKKDGNILDFPIGQYDTYTPLALSQYITTIANSGMRIKPQLVHMIKDSSGKIIYEYKRKELNKISVDDKYINRVQLGFKMVMETGGTGNGYINLKYDPYGKTGTAQSFIDTDGDNVIDTETISTGFVGYAQNASFVVLSPNVSSKKSSYTSSVNKRITRKITDLYFQKYN